MKNVQMVKLELCQMSQSQLDYAAAVIQGWKLVGGNWVSGSKIMCGPSEAYRPSKNWCQLGELIEQVNIQKGSYLMVSYQLLFQSLIKLSKDSYYFVPDESNS